VIGQETQENLYPSYVRSRDSVIISTRDGQIEKVLGKRPSFGVLHCTI